MNSVSKKVMILLPFDDSANSLRALISVGKIKAIFLKCVNVAIFDSRTFYFRYFCSS